MAKSGQTLGDKAFTAPGGVGAGIADQVSDSKLVALFGDGATIVLQALHRVWPPIIDFVGALAAELGHPVQANAYVTPPQNQGFDDHYDVHDVFVLQVAGTKRWRIHAPVWDAPLRDQPWTDRRAAVQRAAAEPPLIEAVLEPGDCLYLPRGFLHAATALGGVSTHLTLGVHTWTRYTLAEQLTAQALRTLAGDADLRASLALGTDPTRPEYPRGRRRAGPRGPGSTPSGRPTSTPSPRRCSAPTATRGARHRSGPLAQLDAAAALEPGTSLRLRAHLAATLDQAGGRSVLRSRAGELVLDEADVAPVKTLLDEGRASRGRPRRRPRPPPAARRGRRRRLTPTDRTPAGSCRRPCPGVRRPSVLLVVIHSEPSAATATLRMRPWSRAKCAFGFAASVPSSATENRHCPCSAPTNAVERVMASPAGEQLLVGDQVAAGLAYASFGRCGPRPAASRSCGP